MTRQWRDERWRWWDIWNVRWRWVCSHGYTDHVMEPCPETDARFWRRRWWSYFPGEEAWIVLTDTLPYYLHRRVRCRLNWRCPIRGCVRHARQGDR